MARVVGWRGATLSAIRQYRAVHGWPPTGDDVARELGMATASDGVWRRLRVLVSERLIRQAPRVPRSLRLTDAGWVQAVDWELRQRDSRKDGAAQAVMPL